MESSAKMESGGAGPQPQQPFLPPAACFFATAAAQSAQQPPPPPPPPPQLSPAADGQPSGGGHKSAPKQVKRQRSGFGYSLPQQQPAAVARRNERERNRVKLVNLGFATLREHVPNGAANKKMSKVETLRSAVEYIRALQQLLDEHDAVSAAFQAGVLSPTISPNYSNDMNSMAGSPVSSYSSDEGSYDPLSPEEQELLDFTNWF
ncbi:hypothetical protein K5549_002591 [Capra hircus]|nr:hypothetical protein K5549_002591 [Capra hircus]